VFCLAEFELFERHGVGPHRTGLLAGLRRVGPPDTPEGRAAFRSFLEGQAAARRRAGEDARGHRRQAHNGPPRAAAGPQAASPWTTLGLAPAAAAAVRSADRRLALQHHPDRFGDPAQFVRLRAAYGAAGRLLGEHP
jgi:hypothetical protein